MRDPGRWSSWLTGLRAAGVLSVVAGALMVTTGSPSQPAIARPAASSASNARPLHGMVVGIDPGHNGRNYTDPGYLNRQVWNGREYEDCDTTGTSTDGGYTEPRFNFRVAVDLRRDLRRLGATVVMTRHNNHGIGPCVTTRAKIINRAEADVAVDIHADGGPSSGRGFTILLPVRDKENRRIVRPSRRFATILRSTVLARTAMSISNYDGQNGLQPRNDLAGLNLAKEPKVLMECGNMRNRADARRLITPKFQRHIATAMAQAIRHFRGR